MQQQNVDKSDDVPLIPVQGQQGGEANIVLVTFYAWPTDMCLHHL